MRFNLQIFTVVLALSVNYIVSVNCQYDEEKNYNLGYDLENSILKSMHHIDTSKHLKSLSEEDIESLQGLPNFVFPIPLGRMLRDVLKESGSSKCARDLDYVFESVFFPGGWAMKMLDSYGKPESGILAGNLHWLGDFDECNGVRAPAKANQVNGSVGDFYGKYCTLKTSLKLGAKLLPLQMGVCLPDSCDDKDPQENNGTMLLHSIGPLGNLASFFQNTSIKCKPTSKEVTAGAIIVALILFIICLLAVIGTSITVFEYYMNANSTEDSIGMQNSCVELIIDGDAKKSDNGTSNNASMKRISLPDWLEKSKSFFNCFCMITNGEKLLNTDSSEGQLPCLHGIRFLSMTWIIMCHAYMSATLVLKNAGDFPKFIDHWVFQIVVNGFFSVDSFFLLSGFLVAYVFFKQADKTDGKIPWLYFYIHRYIRLTPAYLLTMLFLMFIFPYMGSGPLWNDAVVDKFCAKNWWWNMLYINNFGEQAEMCMAWSWYLANDMQFYIISPLFLITLWKWPKIGYSVAAITFAITFISSFAITLKYDLIAELNSLLDSSKDMDFIQSKIRDFFSKIYYKPYARVGPYLVGILLAYIVHKRKKENSEKLNRIYVTVGWILASGLTLTIQFGVYKQVLSKVAAAFYSAFARTIFGLGLAWLIFACVEGQAGTVNRLLSWKVWIPLSRLTYCAYLTHPLLQLLYFTSLKSMVYFTHPSMFILYLGFLIVTYAVSAIVSLIFESPVIRLERLFRNQFASKKE